MTLAVMEKVMTDPVDDQPRLSLPSLVFPTTIFAVLALGACDTTPNPTESTASARATSMAVDEPPATRVEPVTMTVGGVTFDDPYDWLHEDNAESLAWQWQQDAIAEKAARSTAAFAPLLEELRGQSNSVEQMVLGTPRLLGGTWFRMTKLDGAGTDLAIHASDSVESRGKVVLSTRAVTEREGDDVSRSVTWWEPSPDGRFVAGAITTPGDMIGRWYVAATSSGSLVPGSLPALSYTGGRPGWLADGSGFFLSDRSASGLHRVRFVGVSEQGFDDTSKRFADRVFSVTEVPADVSGLSPQVSPDGRWVIVVSKPHEHRAVMIGDLTSGTWRPFAPDGWEGELDGHWLDASTWVARSHGPGPGGDTPRGAVYAIPAATSSDVSTWRLVVPESEAVLRAVLPLRIAGESWFAICDLRDVSTRFRLVRSDGSSERLLPLAGPGTSRVAYIMRAFESSEALTLDYETFTRASTAYHYDLANDELEVIGDVGATLEGVEVAQFFAESSGGVQVPYFVVHRSADDLSSLDAPLPALVHGYGGFNIALLPSFLTHWRPFIRAGGVFVQAGLRGGAEYGREWHESGRLENKQNTFDDLFAVTEDLITRGIATPERLAMQGGSNGGLLAGAAIVQRPDLYRAVVPVVPIFDQMRPFPRDDPSYAALQAIWFEDYGDPEDPSLAPSIYAYSPYHNVQNDTAYPSVFQVFGERDIGCPPFHGRKFTARLQAATSSEHPILFRIWRGVAHGTADLEISSAMTAEWLAFVFHELGMTYAPLA